MLKPVGPSRLSGNEIRYKVCPACGHGKWAVSMSEETGAWFCYVCSAGGGGTLTDIEAMRKRMSPKTYAPWPEVELPPWNPLGRTARKYLRERGILRPEKYGIVELVNAPRVLIPYRGDRGQIIFWSTRAIVPDGLPKYVNQPGRKPLYCLPRWAPAPQSILVEGAFDALAVIEWPEKFGLDIDMDLGYNVISLGGKQLSKTCRDDLRTLAPGRKIIMLDNDAMRQAQELKTQLLNTSIYRLPVGKDPADMVLGEGGTK